MRCSTWQSTASFAADLVKIRIRDLVAGPEIRTRAIIVQQKTGRPVQFEISSDVRASLLAWLERRGGTVDDYAFPSRINHAQHMSTRKYARLVDEWVTAIGLRPEEYGTLASSHEGIDDLQRRQEISVPSRSYSAIPRSRTPSGTLVSM